MKYLLISIILVGCSANWHLNKALKKEPQIVQADVIYVRDTVPAILDGEIIEVPVEIPVPVEVVKWRTRKEKRLDFRFEKAELERFKIVNDTMANIIKRQKAEIKLLKAQKDLIDQETKTEKQETKKLKKENRSGFWDDLKYLGMWLLAIMVAVVVVRFLVLPLLKK